jgi:deoxyribodipyrimidine photolyase
VADYETLLADIESARSALVATTEVTVEECNGDFKVVRTSVQTALTEYKAAVRAFHTAIRDALEVTESPNPEASPSTEPTPESSPSTEPTPEATTFPTPEAV